MHPYTDVSDSRQASNLFQFLSSFGTVDPGVNPVKPNFAARSQ